MEPDYLPALYNLGLVLHEAGRYDEAEACFRRILALDAADGDALFHLGALQQRRMQHVEAAATFRLALRRAPGDPHLWLRLGQSAMSLGTADSLREAAECFARATELRSDLAEAHSCLGYVHQLRGRNDDALRSFQKALELRPDDAVCLANVLWQMQQMCDWSRFPELCAARRRNALLPDPPEPPAEPFGMLSIPSTLAEQLACAGAHARSIARRVAQERQGARFDHGPERRLAKPGRRLRVGYLSADFHEHVTAYVMVEAFELHDRSRLESIGYSYGPDDGSAIRRRLKAAFDRFVDLRQLSDEAAAAAIHADEVDILVELKGFTGSSRPEIVARRPAPVQASFLGYAASMGADFIDYIITDRFVVPPEHLAFYAEQPAYLPGSYYPSDRGRPRNAPPTRRDLNLPDSGFVFCCFNQAFKILPEVFALWMRLLGELPGAVLWLLEGNPRATDNLRCEASRRGIDPSRLVIAPRSAPAEYLRRLAAADLFLDTTPYNAHTTASDALWVGVPVLTCAGDTLPSRVAGSQLMALGLSELVAGSLAEYEASALRLARSPQLLAGLRAHIARARESSALFDTPRLVRSLEALYEEMWRLYVAGERPRPIEARR